MRTPESSLAEGMHPAPPQKKTISPQRSAKPATARTRSGPLACHRAGRHDLPIGLMQSPLKGCTDQDIVFQIGPHWGRPNLRVERHHVMSPSAQYSCNLWLNRNFSSSETQVDLQLVRFLQVSWAFPQPPFYTRSSSFAPCTWVLTQPSLVRDELVNEESMGKNRAKTKAHPVGAAAALLALLLQLLLLRRRLESRYRAAKSSSRGHNEIGLRSCLSHGSSRQPG